ncbi:Gfo/Idh/MocA family protein [Frondihabitans cladoniiphilus]|uniref:Gfo/Idh/MocA family oxidoreductase n=1 Tax=Frondihabitans cladoniiphilus TaxID=715785 RepID=A0ABP8WC13_9MICO
MSPFVFPSAPVAPLRGGPVLRWGVVGTGEIAGDFIDAVHAHTDQRIVAVASRSAERGAAFASAHGVEHVVESAEQLAARDDVDILYVATPHTAHREGALAAIAGGKAALVEKPLATSEAEARGIADAARAARVFVMEAMWTRFLPHFVQLDALLREGALGDPALASVEVAWRADLSAGGRLVDPALGGGALLDMGVYSLWFAQFAIGHPASVQAVGSTLANGVDLESVAALRSVSGALATASTSIRATAPGLATVSGTGGSVRFLDHFVFPASFSLTTTAGGAGSETLDWSDTSGIAGRGGLAYEAAAVAAHVASGLTEAPEHTLDDSVSLAATSDAVRRSLTVVDDSALR